MSNSENYTYLLHYIFDFVHKRAPCESCSTVQSMLNYAME